MKATGEVMSICDNFEGALMKAIRSLEQHVDSLMSYDFSHLSREELLEDLVVVDDRRIWKIAELSARAFPMKRSMRSPRSTCGSSTRSPFWWKWSRSCRIRLLAGSFWQRPSGWNFRIM